MAHMSWHHSGFNVHVCEPIAADGRNALESLAHYIIRCQFSQERMTYLENSGTVSYRSKDGYTAKSFTALDWLALIISHIPRHGEQMVRYYGYYSNAARGKRRKLGLIDADWFVGCSEAAAETRQRAAGDCRACPERSRMGRCATGVRRQSGC